MTGTTLRSASEAFWIAIYATTNMDGIARSALRNGVACDDLLRL